MKQALKSGLKFGAASRVPLPDLRDVVGRTKRLPQQGLLTTYHDTADGRLWDRGLTIRHCIIDGEESCTWTLNGPGRADGSTGGRKELSWSGRRDDLPDEAFQVVRGLIRREPLRQLVVLETMRQRLILQDETGNPVAELDDDAMLVVGGPRDGLRFRQVELAFQSSASGLIREIEARLQDAGLRSEETPTLAKAMDFRGLDAPDYRLDRKATLGDVARASLQDGLGRLLNSDWRLRLPDGPDEHDVHQARVATRRLRSNLKTFGLVFDPVWLSHMQNDLKSFGAALGEIRDLDVLAKTIENVPVELTQDISRLRAVAVTRLVSHLNSEDYLRALDRLHAASNTPPFVPTDIAIHASNRATSVLPALVGRRWKAMRRQVRKAGHQPSDRQLHRIRIKAKHLRYAAEGAARVIGKPAAHVASAAKQVQTVLGQHHDAVEAKLWLEKTAKRTSSVTAFEAGRLTSQQEKRAMQHEAQWRHSWKALAESKSLSWMN